MRLIPVYAEECDVPTMLSGYQRVTMLNRYEDGFTELLVAIRGQAPTPQEVMDLQLQRQPFNATPPDVTVITEQGIPLSAEPLDVRITSDHTPEHDVAPVDSASDRRALPVRTLLLSAAVLGLVVFLIIIAASNLAATPAENSTESTAEGMPTPEGEVITTDSGLMYIEISEGTGAQPQNGQTVSVRYIGYLDNGDVYETSDQHSDPFQYVVGEGNVIKGLDEGVSTMRVGGHRRLIIPPELGYGDQEQPNVPANSQLTLLVELLDVE
jgi:peptidylprolyl isomerase